MSIKLTKKFREGKLKTGYYFVKTTESEDIVICYSDAVELPEMIEDVICEVPSYKEIQKMYIQLIRAHSTIKSMREFKPFGLMISYFRDYIKGEK